MSNNTNSKVTKDFTFNNLKTLEGHRFPVRTLLTEPIREKGSILYNIDDDNLYFSDGFQWIRLDNVLSPNFCITDADGDTSICVDNGTDPDTTIFTNAGMETARMTADNQLLIGTTTITDPSKLVEIAGALKLSGINGTIEFIGGIYEEQSSVPGSGGPGIGRVWVRNDTPNALVFTDDAGTDFVIGGSSVDISRIRNTADTTSIDTQAVADTLTFITSSLEAMRIDPAGDLLVGTTTNTMIAGQVAEFDGGIKVVGGTGTVETLGTEYQEQSTVPGTGGAGTGTLWVKDDDPTVLVFTDSTGVDTTFGGGGSVGPRTYECIVDVNGEGDYLSIGAAVADGCSRIFVRLGTYVETADITIGDLGLLTGEAGAIIVLSAGARIVIDGNGGIQETVGTISIGSGVSAVVGVGTTFTNLSPGDFILLGSEYFEIDTITDDTNLSIVSTHQGRALVGQTYIAQSMVSGIQLANLIILGSTADAIFMRAARNCFIGTTAVIGGAINLNIDSCGSLSIFSFSGQDATGAGGLQITSTVSSAFNAINIFNSTRDGIRITGPGANGLTFDTLVLNNNGGNGFEIINPVFNINIDNAIIQFNDENGVEISASSTSTIMTGCSVVNNGGAGIIMNGELNQIIGSIVSNNGGVGILSGDNSVIGSNKIIGNGGVGIDLTTDSGVTVTGNVITDNGDNGIFISAGSNTITGNRIEDNTGHGVEVVNPGDDIALCNNIITGNTDNGIDFTASRCTIVGNHVENNTNDGIFLSGQAADNAVNSNAVYNNGGIGINCAGDDNIINGNRVLANGGDGVEIASSAARTIVTSNNMRGNTGINFDDNSGTTLAANNQT